MLVPPNNISAPLNLPVHRLEQHSPGQSLVRCLTRLLSSLSDWSSLWCRTVNYTLAQNLSVNSSHTIIHIDDSKKSNNSHKNPSIISIVGFHPIYFGGRIPRLSSDNFSGERSNSSRLDRLVLDINDIIFLLPREEDFLLDITRVLSYIFIRIHPSIATSLDSIHPLT